MVNSSIARVVAVAARRAFYDAAATNTSRTRFLSIGRMLDLGGAPSSTTKNSTRINTSKNMNVQAVCFDFDVLTNSVGKEDIRSTQPAPPQTQDLSPRPGKGVTPNQTVIQEVASLLNISLGEERKKQTELAEDDLSLLIGENQSSPTHSSQSKPFIHPLADIRSKYADKLAKRGLEGGLATVELAKRQREESLKRGDAGGHLAARKIAVSEPVPSSTKWMALTGTGKLLRYLTMRNIKIALLPRPVPETNPDEGQKMDDFQKQLSEVVFDLLYKKGTKDVDSIVSETVKKLDLDPKLIMLVSDRDSYLKAAKDQGLLTCRILPKNARRGNISAHYNIENIPSVEETLNEINGISFNAVFKG